MPEIIQDLYRPSRNFTDRQKRFLDLVPVVECCHACPAMEGRRRVLSTKNGNAKAKIMFVAEAPGRNGADRTGVPIHGDPTGVNFEKLLASVGLERSEVFVTNAVLCNPRDDRGNNRPPSPAELTNCSIHLESTIRIIEPGVIAPLGAKALESLSLIGKHHYKLSEVVGTLLPWSGRYLFPLYHPSPRAMMSRPFHKQLEDFKKLRAIVDSFVVTQ